jgi:amidophosphoribosyltransferase
MSGREATVSGKSWHEECGVFGVWNHPDASRLTYLGLYAIQHRGQESAGIVSLEGDRHFAHKGLGLVSEVFDDDSLASLPGRAALGHVRYSTTGNNLIANAQPLTGILSIGPVAVAHNGNLVNAHVIRQELRELGSIFTGTNDSEVILHLIARERGEDFAARARASLQRLEGAYSLGLLASHALLAARDPYGFRPLCLGELEWQDAMGTRQVARAISSETCAFDLIGARFVREIEPGEILVIDDHGLRSERLREGAEPRLAHCVFEHVYFARPDSVVFGRSVYETRKRAGQILARERGVPADVVVPVPDSGVPAALGYAAESGIPFELGIVRNHYVGRTFIQPKQSERDLGVRIKLNALAETLRGKRVVVIDDSLVRGTTSRKIVALVRHAGAAEVHLRIAAPATTGPCYYGVDTPEKSQLIAANQGLEAIRNFVGADSVAYLSVEGLMEAARAKPGEFCAACFDGKYPTPLFGLDEMPNGSRREIAP